MWLIDLITPYIIQFIRPLIKWYLHRFTRLCELQRLCYGAIEGANRTRQVERSLSLSKQQDIQNFCQRSNEMIENCNEETLLRIARTAEKVVLIVKRIDPVAHPDFGPLLRNTVTTIWGYKRMTYDIEQLRIESYDADNLLHEQKLLRLYELLMPEHPLTARISKQWQSIGFQGEDPKTDFRGMGLLSLENLLYFSANYTAAARHNQQHSMHPVWGYYFAIVGINLTALCNRLVQSGQAKTHFYNVAQRHRNKYNTVQDFHEFYCYLFLEFDHFWLASKPRDIMDFAEIYQKFEIQITELLQKDDTIFRMNLAVEHL